MPLVVYTLMMFKMQEGLGYISALVLGNEREQIYEKTRIGLCMNWKVKMFIDVHSQVFPFFFPRRNCEESLHLCNF